MITKTVKEISEINLVGNITPRNWYQHIKKSDSGRTDHLAISILSDIVYWYRVVEIVDENTNQIIGYNKKFKVDKLQKSYSNYYEFFGTSKKVIKTSIDNLIRLGLIKREFRKVKINNMLLNNVMYLEPIPDKIKVITELSITPSFPFGGEGGNQKGMRVVPKREGPGTQKGGTNTKNTTKNTYKDYNSNAKSKYKDNKKPEITKKIDAAVSDNISKTKIILEKYGIGNGNLLKCLEVLSKKDFKYLNEKILITEFRDKKGIIQNNKSGYLIKAILDDIPPNKKELVEIKKKRIQETEEKLKKDENNYYDYIDSEIVKYKNNINKPEYNKLIKNIIYDYIKKHLLMKNEIHKSEILKSTVIRTSLIKYFNLPNFEEWLFKPETA